MAHVHPHSSSRRPALSRDACGWEVPFVHPAAPETADCQRAPNALASPSPSIHACASYPRPTFHAGAARLLHLCYSDIQYRAPRSKQIKDKAAYPQLIYGANSTNTVLLCEFDKYDICCSLRVSLGPAAFNIHIHRSTASVQHPLNSTPRAEAERVISPRVLDVGDGLLCVWR